MARRVLEGIEVLDFTRVVAGPLCTRMLADAGANVLKIDRPTPDADGPTRATGSPSANLGKRSIAVDLSQPDGVAVARDAVARADVIVENFTPGVMTRLGLGYEQLSADHPELIYASISGFGQSGPETDRRAYGAVAHAEAGLLWVQQQAQGAEVPFAPGITVADIVTGMNTFSGILAALYDRQKTGRGQQIDVTLMESQLAMLSEVSTPALNATNGSDPEAEWTPFRHPVHATTDGHVTINIGSEHNWLRIAHALGHPEVTGDQPADANKQIASWVAELTLDQVAEAMRAAGAPYGIVRTMPDAVNLPYFAARGMIAEVPDPIDGSLRAISSPIHLSNADTGPTAGPPLAGEHSREVLADLGRSAEQIDALFAGGVVSESLAD
jgi:CoA:oxalate CoA-transferase